MDAKKIRRARAKRGDSVTLAAGKVGVSVRTWERWERGESVPNSEIVLRALREYVNGSTRA